MVFGKMFLRKKNEGLTLMELVISLAIVGILAIWMITGLKPKAQIDKAKDSKRKSDLKRIQTALEDYYNDHNCYPKTLVCNDSFQPYLKKIPCDPDGGSYYYSPQQSDCPQYYRVYTKLSYKLDPEIKKLGCQNGCGSKGAYNYGISSSNIGLETGTGTIPTATSFLPAPSPTVTYGSRFVCKNLQCVRETVGEVCARYYADEGCYNLCPTPANDCYAF